MGLDCYMFTAQVEKEDNIIVNKTTKQEVAYWRKCWFLQNYLAEIYNHTVDSTDTEFNCSVLELDLEMLLDLHREMCHEAHAQNLSFEQYEHYDRVSSEDIDELKRAIQFVKNNPEETLYYMGWY